MNQKSSRFTYILFIIIFAVLIFSILFSSTLGVADISIIDSFKIMLSKIPGINYLISLNGIEDKYVKIIIDIRMPRIIMATLIGMGLSSVGCSYQGMFKNPMADPYVLGVSSGAALGATVGMLIGNNDTFLGTSLINVTAFLGALITTLLVYNIAKTGSRVPTVTLLLAGIALSFFFQSCISIIMIFNRQQIERIVFWTMGSVSAASWKQIYFLFPFIFIGVFFTAFYSRELNAMLLGDENAKSLGVNIERVKKIILILSSLLVAAIVSVSGIIGFVGLIIPHAVRIIVGPNHKVLIPFSILIGAIFLVICDTIARNIVPPMELPVGAITALFGSPYFIYLLYQSKKKVLG